MPKKGKEALNESGKESEEIYEDPDHLYEWVSPSNPRPRPPSPEYETPNIQPPPTDKPSDNANSEGIYEAMIEYLKEKLNPSQMDAVAIMLQTMKDTISEDKTKTSGPPPDYQPPPPPEIYETLDMEMDVYSDYQSVVENPATNQPKPMKKKPPPVPQKPRRFREFNPSKNPDDLQELRK